VLFWAVDAAGNAKLAVVGTDVRQTGHFVYTVGGWGRAPLPARLPAGLLVAMPCVGEQAPPATTTLLVWQTAD
jgi:hypothetical protein